MLSLLHYFFTRHLHRYLHTWLFPLSTQRPTEQLRLSVWLPLWVPFLLKCSETACHRLCVRLSYI